MSKNQAIQKLLHKSGLCIRKYSPVALSFVASAGVVVTAIAAAKATPRAVALVYADSRKKHDGDPYAYTKKEAFIASWKCYIPAVAFGASTIACIMGANALPLSRCAIFSFLLLHLLHLMVPMEIFGLSMKREGSGV